jgi:hypothetical protein
MSSSGNDSGTSWTYTYSVEYACWNNERYMRVAPMDLRQVRKPRAGKRLRNERNYDYTKYVRVFQSGALSTVYS